MIKKLFLTLGLAAVMLGGLFIAVAFADGPVFDLDQGDENFRVTGENALDWLGEVTSGDINDDGIPDLIIGASGYDHGVMTDAGAVYAIWGSADLSGTVDLNSSGQAADLIIYGGEESAVVGHVVTSGDWNHDGVDDIVIGADGVSNWQGAVYVINGSSSLPHTLYLTDTTVPYLTVYGQFDGDRLGRAVAIGDVNGDEWQDLIIGAYWADPLSRPRAGTVYVIFGSSEVSGTIDLSAGDEADVTIYGALSEDWTGRWVDYGDVNGDGVQDILIGVSRGDVPGRTDAGKVVVIYGGETISSTTPITIDLATTNVISEGLGLVFYGIDAYDGAGFFVSSGNINGDTGPQGQSYDDLVVTAFRSGYNEDGEAYVIYGGPEITSGVTITSETWGINISDCVDVTIYPGATGDRLGRSIASSDFNGDGYDDVMVGAPRVDRTATITDVGNTYVIYGAPSLSTTINVSPTSNVDILVIGDDAQDESGRACGFGDLNNDDVDDLIIGAAMAVSQTGEVYAIWGPKATSITLEPASTIITAGHSVAYSVTATNAYSQSYDATNYLTSYDDDAAAGGTWNGNVYTAGNDGTWTITATHRGLVDTAEIIVDGTAPVITEISVTSDDGSHFYNPGLSADGGTVYFNSLAGEGAGQNLTVAVTMTEANPASLTGGTAFGSTPPADTDGTDGWTVAYTVGTEPGDQIAVPFTVTDQVWLTDQATIDFIEDNTAPAGSVTAPAGGYVTSTQPTFTADASDTGGSGVASVLFQYGLSGTGVYTDVSTDTASPYQAEWGGESLTDGQTYDLRVIITDNVGNVYTSEAVTVTCDTTDPESSASSPDYDNAGAIAVEWTASDDTSGVASTALYVRAEGGSWADSGLAPQTGISGTFNYTPPADGTYYFQTVATDNAGNQETTPSGSTGTGDDSTIYDTTAPTGTVTAPTGPYVNETQPNFTADADDATSGVASVLFQYGLSGTGVYTDVSTDTESPYLADWGSESLADGQTYNLRVIVTDNVGNIGTSEVVTITCDLSLPTMEPIVEAEGHYYNSAPVFSNFGFDDNEDLDDGWYQIDSYTGTWTELFTDVPGPSWDSDGWAIPGFDELSEGTHTIYFRASDDVGNDVGTNGEWSWQFYKDTTAPTMEAIVEEEGQYYNSAPILSNIGFDDEQALDAGWYQIDSYSGAGWVPLFVNCAGTEWNEDSWELPGFDSLSEGSHTVYFRARDDAGNEEGENGEWSWQFYKDTTDPTITYNDPTAGGTTAWYTTDPGAVIDVDFGWVANAPLDYAQYRVGTGSWQTIFDENRSLDYTDTWAVDWSLLAEGENEISIRVADAAGNVVTHSYNAGSSGFLFRKDSLPPYINTVTVNSDKSGYFYNPGLTEDGGTIYFNSADSQVLTVEVTMTEANPARLDGGTAFGSTPSDTDSTDGWSVSYTVASGAGSENGVLFTVTDQGGQTDTATINFIQDGVTPSATVVTPTGTLTNVSVIQGTAADGGGAGLSKVELQVTDGTNYLQPDGSWATGEAWLTPTGLENWSYDTSGVSWVEVSYTIRVRTTDNVGNVDTSESTFTYEAPAGPTWYVYLPIVLRNH